VVRRRIVAVVVLALVGAFAVLVVWIERAAPPPPVAPPSPAPFLIRFPEGFTRAQMALRVRDVARIAQAERHQPVKLNERSYLRASDGGEVPCFGAHRYADLEGFLFPATYDFVAQTSARTLVSDQIQAFCQRFSNVNLSYARSRNLTRYDVLIIASMVERETAVPSERALVAAVIYNRLRDRMQLGIDATLRYGLHLAAGAPLTERELETPNPYNTRLNFGLPPTPIANPGLASIVAAAHPAAVNYLYYAVIPHTDRQFFTASYSAFEQFLATHGYS
jgi:UPF0755 protein